MRRRWFAVVTGLLAVLLWAAVGALVNMRPPTIAFQVLFVLLMALAVAATVMPLIYLGQARRQGALYLAPAWRNAARQGLLVGVLCGALVALRLVGALTVTSGLLVAVLLASFELLVWLRRRY